MTTTDDINFSPYDKYAMSMPVTMFMVSDRPIHDPAETIKRNVSRARSSGFRSSPGMFIYANKISSISKTYIVKMIPCLVVMMQVTEFSCGGFVIGVTWNHAITDAAGMGQFLQAVASMPVGWRRRRSFRLGGTTCSRGIGDPVPSIEGVMELMTSVQPVEMPILDITIPSRIIKSIMEDCHVRSILECTTREAVTALL